MFTGLVEQCGVLVSRTPTASGATLGIRPDRQLEHPRTGESVAVNGVCLTLERALPDGLCFFHALNETLRRTNLGTLQAGARVNLERALQVGDRIGGHLVSGHVDGTGKILNVVTAGDVVYRIELPPPLRPFIVPKGSIAVDGISLTVVEVTPDAFTVHLIPETLKRTALCRRNERDCVNLEVDMLGRYVAHQLRLNASESTERNAESGVTLERLVNAGF